ncbi:MAG TPA: ATP-binding protein [Streptosporangiaceae bacterium]
MNDTEVLDGDIRFCLVLPHEPVSVPVMRRVLGGTLLGFGADAEAVADLLLAATEACTNVLRHGEQAEEYQVCASVGHDVCLLEIANQFAAIDGKPGRRANGHGGMWPVRRAGSRHGRPAVPTVGAMPANGSDVSRVPQSGRGLAIMQACVDDLTLSGSAERGTVVSMRKRMNWADTDADAPGADLHQAWLREAG